MRFAQILLVIGVLGLMACPGSAALGNSVPVGSSTLIGTLDYGDTFTLTDFGGLPDRTDQAGGYPLGSADYPVNGTPGEGLAVENCYGNPQRSWSDGTWSLNVDTSVSNGAESIYPGTSGGGSDTGMTQTGGAWSFGWGVEYADLRDRFVVQFDAVQNPGWVAVFFGGAPDTWWHDDNMVILFRTADNGLPEIGLFTTRDGVYEVDTGLSSPILAANAWHNYAATIDVADRTAELFVDENSLGVIDFDTVAGGVLSAIPLSASYVGAAYNGGDRMWTDNFQIGAVVPEPGVFAVLASALAAVLVARRRKAA